MERFLARFQISGDAAIAVKTYSLISDDWTCSHLRRDCFVRGQCVRQFFNDALDRCANEGDLPEANQIIKVAVKALADREKVWLNIFRSLQREDEDISENGLNGIMAQAQELYSQIGMLQDVKQMRLTLNPERVTLDDGNSFIHMTFLPIFMGHIVKACSLMRYGQIGIIFYNTNRLDSLIPFDQEEFQREKNQLQNHVRRMIPICPNTGSRSRIYNLAFAPIEMVQFMQNKDFRLNVCRRLEMDFKYLHLLNTKFCARMVLQRTALEPQGEDAGLTPYMEKVERNGLEDSLIRIRIKIFGNENWQTWTYPEVLQRMCNHGRLSERQIIEFIENKKTCQICYLSEQELDDQIVLVDTRTADFTGIDPVKFVKNVAHNDCNVNVPQIVLTRDEVLTQISGHWVKTHASSFMEAFLITAACIHRHVRGKGLWIEKDWQDAVSMVGRVLFRYDSDCKGRTYLARLFCFICFGYMPLDNGRVADWTDLGCFLNIITGGEENSFGKDVDAFTIMLKAVKSVMLLSAQEHVIAVDLAERPLDLHLKDVCFGIEAQMHNEHARRFMNQQN
uniref:Non-structural protein NS1 n=1 Tax=Changuinola virus TaxID=40052 RepID=U5YID1_9REOV|nr:hydrophobic tubular protein NS1 [Changuinola virus]